MDIIQNKQFEEKLKRFAGKPQELVIFADFGKTLTKAFLNKEKIPTSWSSIRKHRYLGEDYIKKSTALFNKYNPIEVNPNLRPEEKDLPLTEWWKLHLELLIEYGFNKEIIKDLIKKGKTPLREGIVEFLTILNNKNIPLIVVSQGLGDIYIESLKEINKLGDNIYFISNLFEFDENGKAIKAKETIIHPYKKGKIEFHKFNFYNKIKDRKNIILLGDALEDLDITKNIKHNNIIKIGFLNENIKENLEKFKQNFDIVLLNDPSMEFINKLLEKII